MQAPIRLYYNPMCMFCHKTLERLQAGLANFPIQLVDVTADPIVLNGLVAVTGKNAVPVVVDLGHATPESTPIISGYSEESLDKLIASYVAAIRSDASGAAPVSDVPAPVDSEASSGTEEAPAKVN